MATKKNLTEALQNEDSGTIETITENNTTPKLGGELDCNSKTINGASVREIASATPLTGTTHTFNYANGDLQKITAPAGGTLTLAFSNMPTGKVCAFIFDIVNGGNCTITHPIGMKFAKGTAPDYTVSGTDRILVTKNSADEYALTVVAEDFKA